MSPLPCRELVERLHKEFPHASIEEIVSIWHNTSRLESWQYIPKHVRDNEPAELTAARMFNVRARLYKCRKHRASAEYARSLCIASYADYSRSP